MSRTIPISIGHRLNQLLLFFACIAICCLPAVRAADDTTAAPPTTNNAAAATAPSITITIDGDVAHTLSWTADTLATQFAADVKTVKYTLSDKDHESRCVPLMDLIKAAGPSFDPDRPKQELQFVVSISATDKFAVCFSLGELLPDFGNKEVWVALDKDGQPLSDRDAPARFIVPSDGKQARWIYGATHIKIVRIAPSAANPTAAPTTQP
jgi:hypothetical protein